ncbi:MBL fold metallo-hydrolase [Brevibacillus fulvus]|uniref:L-ascorbate metabolism protein UlaG (Beta-lactamase superfamily) n=1 Tax=Brevibacillus fulvus TaxID=1125967 RepID=A0A939BVF1_9BACL|nr:MBL fold metallo-hydrolase [Brevibacillus fulvus]MBM7590596.1 L-ascorbate metabolism protein UlaG (beta-lactamase superfamily) [Brevibacillus fulvus]
MFFHRKRYTNLDDVPTGKTFGEMLQWRKERKAKIKDLSYTIPQCREVDLAFLKRNRTAPLLVWIGHASFLLQIHGLNILIDPVWANRMGFEKRLSPPGLPLDELPQIDIVLVSHGHYDHLDFPTLRRLQGNPQFFVPIGLGRLFRKKGFRRISEFSWWEQAEHGGVSFHFVPAQHWTRRSLFDTNTSHWGGWVIQFGQEPALYFSGDSGYFRGFQEIGERFSIGIALMPIGAYEPEWFMSNQHMTPEESIQAFLDLRASLFIPMHYGAFRLADDTPKEALDRLQREWKRRELPSKQLRILQLGEMYWPT